MKKATIFGVTAMVVGGLSASALGGIVPLDEVEPNDSIAEAQFIDSSNYPTGAVAIDGSLSPGDVDYYSFDLLAGDLISATVFDFTADPFDNDSLLGLFDPSGALAETDDDDGIGFLSSIQFEVTETGTWTFAVSGFGDDDFVGDHGEEFDYKLVFAINPIPAPGALALLGLAGLAGARRRRRD